MMRNVRSLGVTACLCAAFLFACESKDDSRGGAGGGGVGDGGDGDGDDGDDGDDDGGEKLDTWAGSGDDNPCAEGEECDDDCVEVEHEPCDDGTTDPFIAMGINCPDELQMTATQDGHPDGIDVIPGFGPTGEWDPTEGSMMAVIASGYTAELFTETPAGDDVSCPTHCNDDFDQIITECSDPAKNDLNQYDPGTTLPAPLKTNDVNGDCIEDPSLLGTGDCSKPEFTTSFSYDFAFFSTEYPYYYGSQFNDMYVAWLESNLWTGNVSFDEQGNPISLNAGFLDFRDDAGTLPEFAGTCMKQHAGTKWLNTIGPVTPEEEITVVFAIFDLSDSILDSYTLLDNWRWGCEGPDKPDTKPVG
jgi:hypothetical protein